MDVSPHMIKDSNQPYANGAFARLVTDHLNRLETKVDVVTAQMSKVVTREEFAILDKRTTSLEKDDDVEKAEIVTVVRVKNRIKNGALAFATIASTTILAIQFFH